MSYGYDPNHPQMIPRAHAKVRYAIKTGALTRKPCEVCGHQPAQAHHEDYNKPLEVIWLCQNHHKQLHSIVCYGLVTDPHAEIVAAIALEGGVVKRAGKATALARGSAAATSPSSATANPSLLGESRSTPTTTPPSAPAWELCADGGSQETL